MTHILEHISQRPFSFIHQEVLKRGLSDEIHVTPVETNADSIYYIAIGENQANPEAFEGVSAYVRGANIADRQRSAFFADLGPCSSDSILEIDEVVREYLDFAGFYALFVWEERHVLLGIPDIEAISEKYERRVHAWLRHMSTAINRELKPVEPVEASVVFQDIGMASLL